MWKLLSWDQVGGLMSVYVCCAWVNLLFGRFLYELIQEKATEIWMIPLWSFDLQHIYQKTALKKSLCIIHKHLILYNMGK